MHFEMWSAICFNLDQSRILLFVKELRLYRGSQYNYQCIPGVPLTSSPHNVLAMPLATFIIVVVTMVSSQRQVNPAAMTIINP